MAGLSKTRQTGMSRPKSEACLDASYHYINHRVALKPADVLCVAGDTCDDPHLFVEFYKAVSPRHKKIFVVFGNVSILEKRHDISFLDAEKTESSLSKRAFVVVP